MKVTFIHTGGTIDKDYPRSTKGWAFEFGEPATSRILQKLNPSFEFDELTPFQKDSLELDEIDRKEIVKLIVDHSNNTFIITHGTDTMVETAKYLRHLGKENLIIITGAMRPERFSNSDADINLGLAIGACSALQNGIYIAMHGIVKKWDEINRDLDSGKYF